MLKVLSVAAIVSAACVTVASAAPGLNGLHQVKSASDTAIELVGGRCHTRACKASRRKASRAHHHERRRSHRSHHRSRKHRVHAARDSSDAPRSCLTSAARGLLSRIESHFGRVRVISTCRPGARIAGTNRISRHASGNAVDFDAGGRKPQIVSWLIAHHKSGGTMTYPDMSHIHVDIGPHFVSIAGGRHYASWSRKNKAGHRSHRSAKAHTHRKIAIKRGPSMARANMDVDDDD